MEPGNLSEESIAFHQLTWLRVLEHAILQPVILIHMWTWQRQSGWCIRLVSSSVKCCGGPSFSSPVAKDRPLFSISSCSWFPEVAPLAAVTLSPMASTTLISTGGSLCTKIGRVGTALLAFWARCLRLTGFLPGRILGIFQPENSARRWYFWSNWGFTCP